MKNNLSTLFIATIFCIFLSCSSNNKTEDKNSKNNDITKSETEIADVQPSAKGPIINMQDSVEFKQIILCIRDSSNTIEGMYKKLSNIYNVKLQETLNANKMVAAGSPMAWQTIKDSAYFFEAGIPIDKTPSKMGKGMYLKSTGTDSTAIAHFTGPQNFIRSAYDALNEKLADMHKTKSADAYEIYKGVYFPANNEAVDFYKLQIDVITPYKGYIAPKIKEIKYTAKELQINNKSKSKTKAKKPTVKKK